MAAPPLALSPQQVNSWPVNEKNITPDGVTVDPRTERDKKEAFLYIAREQFKMCADAANDHRAEMLKDLEFYCGDQWDARVKIIRDKQDRPCETINRMPQFVRHVANNMRQARPAIKIQPVADGADEDIAEVKQGLIRHIETNSKADTAYDVGFQNMAIMGLGWLRVVDDWASPMSFDKELFVRWVPDTMSVYFDPRCQQPDWSDGKVAFVVEDLTKGDFISRFGKDTEAASLTNFTGIGNDQKSYWFPGDKIRIAEYFHVEMEKGLLCEIEDGSTMMQDKLPAAYEVRTMGDGTKVVAKIDADGFATYAGRTDKRDVPVVHWALISAVDILDQRVWKGKHIPLIPIIGEQIEVNGKRVLAGMIRYARSPQQMYNFMYTSFVEAVALAPKAPFVGEAGQFEGYEALWEVANKLPQAFLPYKARVTDDGQFLVPPPQRQQAEPPIAAFVQGITICDNMMKSIFSIYDASLGQRGPQESGLAINARKVESDTGTYNWGDNFLRALRLLGIILDDLLPYYYNTPGRIVQLTGEDETLRKIIMNQPFQENGEQKHFDLSKQGRYAVVVSTGPSYQTRRQETANSMMELLKVFPQLAASSIDIIIKALDFPEKDSLIDRVRKTLPPGLVDDQNAPPIPPEVQGQLAQSQQMIQQLAQALHEATDKNQLQERKEEWQTFRDQLKNEVTLLTAEMQAKAGQAELLAQKIYDHLEWTRNLMQSQLERTQDAQQASGGNPPTQTGGVQPSVGG